MIAEAIILVGGIARLYYIAREDYYKTRKKVLELPRINNTFTNKNEGEARLISLKGNVIKLDIAGVCSADDVEAQKDFLKAHFRVKDVKVINNRDGTIDLRLIENKKFNKKFEVVPQKEFEVFIGYEEGKPLLVNMNTFPHMLIGGDSGTGKSRFLMMVLTNLIANCKDIDLFLIQIRKSDLIVFKNTKQCKYVARSLEDTKNLLKYLNNLCIKRDAIIEKYMLSKGIYNIEDYNRYFKFNKMKYCYVVLDEFSFFTPNGADDKDTKELKKEILGYIKQIVNTSRSSGIFVITSLQKPTNSSMPTDIKNQLTTRVAFKFLDKETSMVVLGNTIATKLQRFEAIIRTNEQPQVNIPFIDHKAITEAIKEDIETHKKYIKLKKEIKTQNDGVINNEGIVNEK